MFCFVLRTCDCSSSDFDSALHFWIPIDIGCDFTIFPVIWGLQFLGFIVQVDGDADNGSDENAVIKTSYYLYT